jgi:hypothetical protein
LSPHGLRAKPSTPRQRRMRRLLDEQMVDCLKAKPSTPCQRRTRRLLDEQMVAGRPRPIHIFASGHGSPMTAPALGRREWGPGSADPGVGSSREEERHRTCQTHRHAGHGTQSRILDSYREEASLSVLDTPRVKKPRGKPGFRNIRSGAGDLFLLPDCRVTVCTEECFFADTGITATHVTRNAKERSTAVSMLVETYTTNSYFSNLGSPVIRAT